MFGIIFLVILVVIAVVLIGMYNSLVQLRVRCDSAWSDIDVQLKRRYDLIPNLVATVKGYATHEEKVFDDIASARSALLNAHDPQGKIQANGQLDGALGRLLALSENYPDLKLNQNFQRLSDELAGTENRISVARMRYNQNIQDYNTFIGQFPNSIWAGIGGFQRNNDYFQASPGAQSVPKVSF